MTASSDTPTPQPRRRGFLPPWYYATRTLGAAMVVYGVVADQTAERGTIILTGAGLLGIDKVARSEPGA